MPPNVQVLWSFPPAATAAPLKQEVVTLVRHRLTGDLASAVAPSVCSPALQRGCSNPLRSAETKIPDAENLQTSELLMPFQKGGDVSRSPRAVKLPLPRWQSGKQQAVRTVSSLSQQST